MKPLVYNSQPSVGQCKQQSRSTLMGSALSSEERVPFHLIFFPYGSSCRSRYDNRRQKDILNNISEYLSCEMFRHRETIENGRRFVRELFGRSR